MKKQFLLLLTVVFFYSCDKDDTIVDLNQNSRKFPVEYVDYQGNDQVGRIINLPPILNFDLQYLNSDCDLSGQNLQSFSTPVNVELGGFTPTYPSVPGTYGSDYGQFPSSILTKALTGIYNNQDYINLTGFLFADIPPPGNNPVTGNPYYISRVNNFYHAYKFNDYIVELPDGSTDFSNSYLTGEVSRSNELKELIACQLIEEANDIDDTAFIHDIGIEVDAPVSNLTHRFVMVYVRWGYHY